ncbi:ATP-dependent helicase, partial [Streptomyces sp. SID335]|nr:ATP-dependent helicase [Streptomyces sp. SID335]
MVAMGVVVPEGGGEAARVRARAALVRSCAAVFLPAEVPREGRVAFWNPDPDAADGLDEAGVGVRGDLVVARRHGKGARSRTVPALFLPVAAAVPLLLHAEHPHPAVASWGAAARHALHLAA